MNNKNSDLVYYKDMYNIYNLITKVDKSYRLCFNRKNKLFVIINSAKKEQICYKSAIISPNCLKTLEKTRVENIEKIMGEIDENNELILSKNQQKFKNIVSDKTKEILNLSRKTSVISHSSINKIIGEKIC